MHANNQKFIHWSNGKNTKPENETHNGNLSIVYILFLLRGIVRQCLCCISQPHLEISCCFQFFEKIYRNVHCRIHNRRSKEVSVYKVRSLVNPLLSSFELAAVCGAAPSDKKRNGNCEDHCEGVRKNALAKEFEQFLD